MKTIVIPAGENAAISREVIAAMNELSEINANSIGLVMNNAKSAPNVIVWGVLEQDGNLSIGLVSINGELLRVYDGVSTSMIAGPNLGCLEIVEDTSVITGTDDQGNSYNTTIKNRYCKPSATGTALSLFRRATLATKEGGDSNIAFSVQNADQPFDIDSVTTSKIDQFGRYKLIMKISSTAQQWGGWHRICAMPAAAIPSTDREVTINVDYSYGIYSLRNVFPAIVGSNGFLSVWLSGMGGDTFPISSNIQIEYDL